MDVIAVKNLTKYYGNFKALDNINFNIQKGEIFGLLGPNGAGKTTTVRILTTLLPFDSGSVRVGTWDLKKDPFKIKHLFGLVPEIANVYPDLTAMQNMKLMCSLYSVPKGIRKQCIEELLKKFQLFEVRNKRTKKFSKGMKQRLILCMALVHNPEILFLDEPTAGLDVQSSRLIKNLIKEYNKNGTTIFITTHDMDVANDLCDRIAIINKGKIVALDAPENLKKQFQEIRAIDIEFFSEIDEKILQNLPQINKIIKINQNFRLFTENPTETFIGLMDLIEKQNLKIKMLNLQNPRFEDIFIKIIEES